MSFISFSSLKDIFNKESHLKSLADDNFKIILHTFIVVNSKAKCIKQNIKYVYVFEFLTSCEFKFIDISWVPFRNLVRALLSICSSQRLNVHE